MNQFNLLEENINTVADLLLQCIENQKNNNVKNAIKTSASPAQCLHFEEPTYIDLYDFYTNVIRSVKSFSFKDDTQGADLTLQLINALKSGRVLLTKLVLANVAGSNLSRAQGLSIYFPLKIIHPSYQRTPFWQSNNWAKLLTCCLQ